MLKSYIQYVILTILFFFFQAEDGIRDIGVTGVQTCALPIYQGRVLRIYRQPPDVAAVYPRVGRLPALTEVPALGEPAPRQIGRASCRERVEISVVAVSLKKK